MMIPMGELLAKAKKEGYGVEIYNFKKYGEKYMVLRNPTGI